MKYSGFVGKWLRRFILAILLFCALNVFAINVWSYHQENDRLTNRTYSLAQSPMPRLDLYDELKLQVSCRENRLQVVIEADSLIASQGAKFDMEYQIDKKAPITIQMRTFSDSKRKGYTDNDAKPIVDGVLAGREAIFIRVKTMIGKVLSASIPLPDAAKPIQQVMADCDMTLPDSANGNSNYTLSDFEQNFNKLSPEQKQKLLRKIEQLMMEMR